MAADLPPWVDIDDIAARRTAGPSDGWEERAACRTLSWRVAEPLFFPTNDGRRGSTMTRGSTITVAEQERRTVRDYCAFCSVAADCVATHVTETDGVFGSTPGQRVVIRRRLAEAGQDIRWIRDRVDPRKGIPRSSDAVRQARARAR